MNLEVNELFYSIEGETLSSGFPAIFIRLSGCNLNCRWCDTPGAKEKGNSHSIESILKAIAGFTADHVTVTGGEPLCQTNSIKLMNGLLADGHRVQLETNGSISVKDVPASVRKIIDVKTPSSGEERSFCFENLQYVLNGDEIKFVIADRIDYEFSRDFMKRHLAGSLAAVDFSPAYGIMEPATLASMLLEDRLPVRLNLQLHTILWGEREGKVEILLDSGGTVRYIDRLKKE